MTSGKGSGRVAPWKKAGPVVVAALIGTMVGANLTNTAKADLLGSVLKGGAAVVLVHQFANQLNDFINGITANHHFSGKQATKVVPMVSLGQGTYAGAAQVAGENAQLGKVKAVGVLEGEFHGHQFRARALVPIDTDNPAKGNIHRVEGVGVSAIIDIKL
ncbi:MAG TPA: hypothetical protein VFW40_06255 [Capsulimonadaceae bacterium]|nr:hypothetical protein [Capsulimonadaceae bacterium]